MVITVTVQVPMKEGDVLQTPFGPETISAAQAASGYYNKTVSASRVVTSALDPSALANQGADVVSGMAAQSQ